MARKETTPLMQQYEDIKHAYPDALVLFQVGDFYELFYDDAKTAASFLGIALTARGKNKDEPIPLCGVPVHTRDHYIAKLVKGGFKVAICDQLEEPKPGTVVKRGVTQLLTPGTITDSKLLDDKSASYLFSFVPLEDGWGLVFGELLTAQLFATTLSADAHKQLEAELSRFFPDEIIIPQSSEAKKAHTFFKQRGYFVSTVYTPADESESASWITSQFSRDTHTRIEQHTALKEALSNMFAYLKRTQESSLSQFSSIHFYEPDDYLMLDAATQRNLELVENNHDGSSAHTLFSILDRAQSSMGSRMLKKWILRPLVNQSQIHNRQEVITRCIAQQNTLYEIESQLRGIGDIERIIGRIGLQRAQRQDYIALKEALKRSYPVSQLLHPHKDLLIIASIRDYLGNFNALHALLERSLESDFQQEHVIKKGFNERLDRMRSLVSNAHKNILDFEQREQEKTGINSLKVRYNNVHGYYIEVTKTHMNAVPDYYKRQQTLVGRERYITPELHELQHELLTARNEIEHVEKEIFDGIKKEVYSHITELRKLAHALSHLDALACLARIAYEERYSAPTWNNKQEIIIQQGRHPVVEQMREQSFIPNNTNLCDAESMWIITGPNMGGKSTYLRQVALIQIMAQMGSYIPAQRASLPIVDRIFTRIGAGDNVAQGKSTFLVEMEETAAICTHATSRSLVILDEVGRGTSTFDGLAIAQAVVEHIHTQIKARCLFATHYHELTHISDYFPGIAPYYAASSSSSHGIIFLYQMIKGVADGSFGIEVAKRAELPNSIITRAQNILETLTVTEEAHSAALARNMHDAIPEAHHLISEQYAALKNEYKKLKDQYECTQRELKNVQHILAPFSNIDYNNLSPKQAFDLLWDLKK